MTRLLGLLLSLVNSFVTSLTTLSATLSMSCSKASDLLVFAFAELAELVVVFLLSLIEPITGCLASISATILLMNDWLTVG